MLKVQWGQPADAPFKVLCLGAHSDDIEIGCGGTVLHLIEFYKHVEFYWVVLSSGGHRVDEAQKSADAVLASVERKTIVIKDFRNSFFPYVAIEIKEYFEQLTRSFTPDLILTHHRNDLHQDHRLVAELTSNAFRNHLILEYEIPKFDGDFGSPNVFVPLDESTVQRKVDLILNNFHSQHDKQWFDKETFMAVIRLRGIEANSPSKYAEGFYCRKVVIG